MLFNTTYAQINPNGGFENGLANWYIASGSCKMEVVESFVYNDSTILPFEGKKLLRVYQNNGTFGDCIIASKVKVNKIAINEYEFMYASIFLSTDSNLQFKDREIYYSANKTYPVDYNGYKRPLIQYKYGGLSKSLDLRYQYPNLLVDSIEL